MLIWQRGVWFPLTSYIAIKLLSLHPLKKQKNTRTLNYIRQANRETKKTQSDKKGKMLVLFNKVDKVCVLDNI